MATPPPLRWLGALTAALTLSLLLAWLTSSNSRTPAESLAPLRRYVWNNAKDLKPLELGKGRVATPIELGDLLGDALE